MRPVRAYVDTSVFGGTQDEEFAAPSRRFFDRVERGAFVVLVSDLTTEELAGAPEAVRQVYASLPRGAVEEVPLGVDVQALARAYMRAGALGPARQADAVHVAAATVARADLILSWNFKHVVNFARIRVFNGINELNGYARIAIHSPLEVV